MIVEWLTINAFSSEPHKYEPTLVETNMTSCSGVKIKDIKRDICLIDQCHKFLSRFNMVDFVSNLASPFFGTLQTGPMPLLPTVERMISFH